MTQEDLADETGLSVGTISDLEKGKAGYSDKSLGKIADALEVEIGMILSVDPNADAPLWALLGKAKDAEKEQIAKVARALIKKQ